MEDFEVATNTPKTFKRNSLGLLDGVNYVYNEDGSIDLWAD
jgi:hypothetical protein